LLGGLNPPMDEASQSAHQAQVKAATAQVKLADSAVRLKDSAELQLESAERRTILSADRTVYAAERTYAAWMRTGLAALVSGVGARSLLADVRPDWLPIAAGTLLIAYSAFCFVAGVWREMAPGAVRPKPDASKLPAWILVMFTAALVAVDAAAIIGIWR